jgi:hypothetical protein
MPGRLSRSARLILFCPLVSSSLSSECMSLCLDLRAIDAVSNCSGYYERTYCVRQSRFRSCPVHVRSSQFHHGSASPSSTPARPASWTRLISIRPIICSLPESECIMLSIHL